MIIPEEILKEIREVKPEKKREEECYFWVTAYANEGDCGVHKFQIEIIN